MSSWVECTIPGLCLGMDTASKFNRGFNLVKKGLSCGVRLPETQVSGDLGPRVLVHHQRVYLLDVAASEFRIHSYLNGIV